MKRLINRLTSLVLILSLSICIFPNAVIPAHAASASVWYTLHVQDIGWMKSSHDGETNGTTGKSLRAEAVQMEADIEEAARFCPNVERVFLEHGDAFVLSADRLIQIADAIHAKLPRVKTIPTAFPARRYRGQEETA